jgi:hypothetical protein
VAISQRSSQGLLRTLETGHDFLDQGFHLLLARLLGDQNLFDGSFLDVGEVDEGELEEVVEQVDFAVELFATEESPEVFRQLVADHRVGLRGRRVDYLLEFLAEVVDQVGEVLVGAADAGQLTSRSFS